MSGEGGRGVGEGGWYGGQGDTREKRKRKVNET